MDRSIAHQPADKAIEPTTSRQPAVLDDSAPLVQTSRAVIQRAFGGQRAGGDAGAVHAAASEGAATSAGTIPHQGAIERSFGQDNVAGVRSHVAPDACAKMDARAFASGNDIVFAESAPSLHTVAHEVAHVQQQRAGVQLEGGVGVVGDRYEREADSVADAVVAGESVADRIAPATRSEATAVQGKAVQMWNSTGHKDLTIRAAVACGLSTDETVVMAMHCNDPDYSGKRFVTTIPKMGAYNYIAKRQAEAVGVDIGTSGEGPDHGEGLNYNSPDKGTNAAVNIAAVNAKIAEAVTKTDPNDKSLPHMAILGWAIHMAQDRGSHCEGTKGEGHDNPGSKFGGKYDCDDSGQNSGGYSAAFVFSKEVINAYKAQVVTAKEPGADTSLLGGESDNNALAFTHAAKAQGRLGSIAIDTKVQMIRNMVEGDCGDDEEQACNDLLSSSSPSAIETIVKQLGNGSIKDGIEKLDKGIDGSEWDDCKVILGRSPAVAKEL